MRKKAWLWMTLLLCACCLFAACATPQTEEGTPQAEEPILSEEELLPEDPGLQVEEKEEYYELKEDDVPYSEVSIGMVELTQQENEAGMDAVNYDLQQMADAYLMRVQEEDSAMFAADDSQRFTHEMQLSVFYQDENIISIVADVYDAASGAAHGTTARYGYVYDIKTGERLTIDRLAGADYQETLIGAIYQQVEAAGDLDQFYPDLSRLLLECFTEDGWYADDSTLYILYQPYSIAPYSMGVVEFKVAR